MITDKEIHALEQAFKEVCACSGGCDGCPLSLTYIINGERLMICNAEYVLGRIAVFNAIERNLIV